MWLLMLERMLSIAFEIMYAFCYAKIYPQSLLSFINGDNETIIGRIMRIPWINKDTSDSTNNIR